tara:strand:+ start:2169 stop:2336 length:168 start_codon:yes stop_codon:yes gene_type:complete
MPIGGARKQRALSVHGCGGNMQAGLPSSVGVPLAQRLKFTKCCPRINKGTGKCKK